MVQSFIVDPRDNVATVLENVNENTSISVMVGDELKELKARQPIPSGHKIATQPIKEGEAIVKYGSPIGKATQDIQQGDHVHVHNVKEIYTLKI